MFLRVADRNQWPIKQYDWSNKTHRLPDNRKTEIQDTVSTGQQDKGTKRKQDDWTTGEQNNGTTGKLDNWTMGQRNNRTTGL